VIARLQSGLPTVINMQTVKLMSASNNSPPTRHGTTHRPGTMFGSGPGNESILLDLTVTQRVSVAGVSPTKGIYDFLSEKDFCQCEQSDSPYATVCALVFEAKGWVSGTEQITLE